MRLLLAALLLLFSALPVGAQERASATAHITITDVLVLRVSESAGPGAATGAATLRVSANRGWKVMISAPGADPARFRWRVATPPGGALTRATRSYTPPGLGMAELARGERGRETLIEVDYRWEAEPPPALTYTLVPN